jgi:hypothetical protein
VPHPLWVFKGAGADSVLSALPFGQFSTVRSNGTNKVIDTRGTFLLFSYVYIEAQPRRNIVHRSSPSSFKSFNSFTSNSFRTLSCQWSAATPVFSDASGLFPSRWGCIPLSHSSSTAAPRISTISPRPSLFSSTAYKMLLPQISCFDNHPFSWGVHTPLGSFPWGPRKPGQSLALHISPQRKAVLTNCSSGKY